MVREEATSIAAQDKCFESPGCAHKLFTMRRKEKSLA